MERTLSKFAGDPCPVRRGLAAAVRSAMYEKHVFFAAVQQNERSQSLVWVSTRQRGKPVRFLLSDPTIAGLSQS